LVFLYLRNVFLTYLFPHFIFTLTYCLTFAEDAILYRFCPNLKNYLVWPFFTKFNILKFFNFSISIIWNFCTTATWNSIVCFSPLLMFNVFYSKFQIILFKPLQTWPNQTYWPNKWPSPGGAFTGPLKLLRENSLQD